MVKITKSRTPNHITVNIGDEIVEYEVIQSSGFLIPMDDGPELVIENIVWHPEHIILDNIYDFIEELNNSDTHISANIDFTFTSSKSIEDYPIKKVNKIIDFCKQNDIWVGWYRYDIGININRSFDENDANDIVGYGDRKIKEIIKALNEQGIATNFNPVTIMYGGSYLLIDLDKKYAKGNISVSDKNFDIKIEPGFRGYMAKRIIFDSHDYDISEVSKSLKNNEIVKLVEILLDRKLSIYNQTFASVEFDFQ